MNQIKKEIKSLRANYLFRSLKEVEKRNRLKIEIKGKNLVNFCGNDYLGLATDARIKQCAITAIKKWGTSASASRLVSGNFSLHLALEERLKKFKNAESALVFPSGYQTNLGAISSLVGKDDVIFSDRLNHASLIDGARLSKARIEIFPHLDLGALEKKLAQAKGYQRKLIIIESLYSMDGDIAPLKRISSLAEKYQAWVYLDEAHSTGVLGKTGRGALEHFGITTFPENFILMGTLSKALVSQGGFVCASKEIREYLINRARSFIYSTGLNPPALASALKALEIIEQEKERIDLLRENVHFARNGLLSVGIKLKSEPSPIIPIIIGNAKRAVQISQKLFALGFFIQAIRPPSVPEGSSRLRLTISAGHKKDEMERLLEALARILVKI